MYNIVVVDDEKLIRDGLCSYAWESLGFRVVGAAANGAEAMELVEHVPEPVHVVIADIRMPQMDGLQLSQELERRVPHCRKIIVTGFKDFEYARRAIETRVAGFLMKPVSLTAIDKLMVRVRASLDEEARAEDLLSRYRTVAHGARHDAVNALFWGVLKSDLTDIDELDERMQLLEVRMPFRYHAAAVIEPCAADSLPSSARELSSESLQLSVCTGSTETVAVLNFDHPGSAEEVREYAVHVVEDLLATPTQVTRAPISVGVGNVYSHFLDLATSYKEAKEALNRHLFRDESGVFRAWSAGSSVEEQPPRYPYDEEQRLINLIVEGAGTEVTRTAESFLAAVVGGTRSLAPGTVQDRFLRFLSALNLRLERHGIPFKTITANEEAVIDFVHSRTRLSELVADTAELIAAACSRVERENAESATSCSCAIREAAKFVRLSFHTQLTLDLVSQQVGLSASYFSVQFKKEMGKSFVQFVRDLRLERAKELLRDPALRVYEVGEAVGFRNPKYFTDVFKDHTGMTPGTYRQRHTSP
jgi:two-component system, response regulator YesN